MRRVLVPSEDTPMATEAVEWPDRMNPTDALFWLLDKIPEMRSTTAALLVLERAPSRQRIRAAFERLCENLPRLRQQVLPVPLALAPPEWVDDPQFDLDYHLRHLAVCEPCSLDSLLEELGPLYATAFDPERPLWEAYAVEGLVDGRGVLFVKLHHCVTDGIGGSRLFSELFGDRLEPDDVPLRRPARGRPTTTAALLWRALLYNLDDALRSAAGTFGAVRNAVRRPDEVLGGIRRGVRFAMGVGQELTGSRADSPLHHHRSLSRRLSTFEMALAEIDAVRGPLRATNNDIVLTVVSGAMHRWHTSRGSDVRELQAMVPVSVRGDEDAKAGNRLALLAVRLPIGEPNPLRRLRLIQERMGRIKYDRRATAYPVLARVVAALPPGVAEQLLRQQTARTNFVCTNVPGPKHPCYFAGELIERIYPYAPLVGDHPVAIALFTYRGRMWVGLDVDPLAMDDLPHFLDALRESYAEILNVGRQADVRLPRRPGRRPATRHRASATR
jgi:diacylglycerol O-acyltransferase